jgi:hypothetical protein
VTGTTSPTRLIISNPDNQEVCDFISSTRQKILLLPRSEEWKEI